MLTAFRRMGSSSGVRSVVAKALPSVSKSCMGSVSDVTLNITFVDNDGNRASVPALVGQTILDVAKTHGIDLEGPCGGGGGAISVQRTEKWHDTTYGEGPLCFFCHVQIPSSFDHLLPAIGESDAQGLDDVWQDEVTSQSRLACQITLDKKHEGMVVYVPDAPPTDII